MSPSRLIHITAALFWLLKIIVCPVAMAEAMDERADLVLRGGKIVTVDEHIGTVQAIAVKGDRIIGLGSDEAIAHFINDDTRIIELNGRLAIPGFIDSHSHFVGLGEAMMTLDLMNVRSWQEVIDMVAEAVKHAEPGEWIIGRGWHQEKWERPPDGAVDGFPTHWDLSEVSPDNPVLLRHASGHASFANKRAMDESNLSGAIENPPGGEVLRDQAGNLTGVFRQNAQGLIRARTAFTQRERFEQMDRAIDLAIEACLSNGITSFQDAGSPFPVIDRLADRARAGTLGVRLWVMIRTQIDEIDSHAMHYSTWQRIGNNHLTVGGIKFAIDGALGSRGAWLLEPYEDSPDESGFNTTPLETLEQAAEIALRTGLQLCIHAIGDRGNRETLDLFERAFARHDAKHGTEGAGRKLRWRIEHAQHLHRDDVPRFGELGVIASMQGIHCTSDGPWVYTRLGDERAESGAYVWRDLMQSGAVVTNGTDAPVEKLNPIASFHASVTRRLDDGTVFFPNQRMSRMDALRSYTINGAYAAFEEDIKGTLRPGKLADIVVLSKDILTVPEEQMLDAQVDLTIIGGQVMYERSQ
jgi:predicted amidohydrolase YtcJ